MTLPPGTEHVGDGVFAVDTLYLRPQLAASHILVDDGEAAFVDTGTNSSVPALLAALHAIGLDREAVRWVFLTHIHLDHAGGAGLLMQSLPNARCVVHPRGSRHMVDPSRLMAGTRAVYGDELTENLYGEILPIAEDRIVVPDDNERFELGSRQLDILYTEGHAKHHYCLHDPAARSVFTGDSFGISYRHLDTDRGPFVFPTTTPIHFDPDAAHAAIDRITGLDPEALYLTHYSRVGDVGRLARDMHECLDGFVAIANQCRDSEERTSAIAKGLYDFLADRIRAHGFAGDDDDVGAIINDDVKLNAQGLDVWLSHTETTQ